MSMYGFNRSTLNGGISTIVAEAAMVIAVSGFAAEGVKTVHSSASVAAISTMQATGNMIARGDGDFVATSSGSAWPVSLQLHSANIPATSRLQATYTDVWGHALGVLTGEGFITRPGTGVSTAVSTGSATALLTAGVTSQLVATSAGYADASVQLNGQSTVQRDGYVQAMTVSSTTTANGLRTALGYVTAVTASNCITGSIKTHGGRADMSAAFTVVAIASTDTLYFEANSGMAAVGTVTRNNEAYASTGASLTAWPTRTTFVGQVGLVGVSDMVANDRTALLGSVSIVEVSAAVATGTIYKMAGSTVGCSSVGTADARLALLGEALVSGSLTATALGGLIIPGTAHSVATFSIAALGYSNAEAPDPAERTMYRSATDRTMYRPFTYREMRRSA